MPTYQVPFIARAKAHEEVDGFDMVFVGKIVLEDGRMSIYEAEEYDDDATSATPIFTTHLGSIDSIECRKFVSGHGRFGGGRIRIFGTFDRGFPEKITMKMQLNQYELLVSLFELMG
jgi:hypothetical protein